MTTLVLPDNKIETPTPAELITTDWRITKARAVDGRMTWKATTTKFSEDQQGDTVLPEFYLTARRRMKSGTVPAPFFSVAHFPLEKSCIGCGYEYKGYADHHCPSCKRERLIAGAATDIWIDGKMPKAEGIFYPTALGKSVFDAVQEDIALNRPLEERVRISMGFFPDIDGVSYPAPGKRVFKSGWVEHFAGTRVPVIPETPLEAQMTINKSMPNIRTRYDDAASFVPKNLADELQRLSSRGRQSKSDGMEIVYKGQTPEEDAVDAEANDVLKDVQQLETQEPAKEEALLAAKKQEEELKSRPEEEALLVETFDVLKSIKGSDDPMLQSSYAMLFEVHKALLAPGNEKAEILARAANLIRAIRDYAHTLTDQPTPVPPTQMQPNTLPPNAPEPPPGQVTDQSQLQDPVAAEAAKEEAIAAAAEEGDASPELTEETPDQEDVAADAAAATAEEAPVDEEAVEEAVEDVAEAAADEATVPTDEVEEEGAVPDEQTPPVDAEEEAERTEERLAPPLPEPPVEEEPEEEDVVPGPKGKKKVAFGGKKAPPFGRKSIAAGNSVTARAEPKPAVKSAAKHPAEVFVDGYARTLATVLSDPVLTRTQKREKVIKALQHLSERVEDVIEATTPITEKDLSEVVAQEVRKALANNNAQSREQMTTLQATVEELQRQLVQTEIAKSLGDLPQTRVQRRSFVPAPQGNSQLPQASVTAGQLASSGPEVKGMSARDAARLSLMAQNPVY